MFRFRKSFKIAPGVRVNFGAKSASVRVGPRSLGYAVSTTGKKRLSANIPGTGLSYAKEVGSRHHIAASSEPVAYWEKRSSIRYAALVVVAIVGALVWIGLRPDGLKLADERLPNNAFGRATLFSTANVRLRAAPSVDSQIITTVPKGSEVFSAGRDGAWHQVSYGKDSGWIHGDYLAEARPSPDGFPSATRTELSAAQTVPAISSRATIIDGDTIEISGTRVRFNGIDAPEGAQLCQSSTGKSYRCGQVAAKALDAWLAESRPTTCQFVEWDNYGRFVGNCRRSDGAEVATWLVSSGHAMDWPRHSQGAFASHQDAARRAKRGIWQGAFQPPWEWRAAEQAKPNVEATSPVRLLSGSCNIKGNISNKGVRIYHVPGQRFYNETVITPGKGERMFCSEDEARAAGWRRSKT